MTVFHLFIKIIKTPYNKANIVAEKQKYIEANKLFIGNCELEIVEFFEYTLYNKSKIKNFQ